MAALRARDLLCDHVGAAQHGRRQAAEGADALASATGGAAQISDEHVRVIELNCFYAATGMGMFDYHGGAELLNHGPFELRVRTEPLLHAHVKMENEWRALLRGEEDASRHTDRAWRQLEQQLQQPTPPGLLKSLPEARAL